MRKTFLAAAASIGALMLASTPASATDITFNLDNVKLVDGGTLTGWFTANLDTFDIVDFEITSSANSTFTGATYTKSGASSATLLPQYLWATFSAGNSILLLNFKDAITPKGVELANTGYEFAGGYSRATVSGSLSPLAAPVPEPATWAMMIGGLALVGSSMRRRKVKVSFA